LAAELDLNAADLAKLDGYVSYLEKKAADEEKSEQYVDEIATCLKLVDVLLVVAEASASYPKWLKCTDKAASYQKKIKALIGLASAKQKEVEEISVPSTSAASKTPHY
jgi:hypothetical protein